MTEILVMAVVGLLVIAAATVIGPRLGIAAPLVLVAIGVAASFIPIFSSVHIDPELILAGVLPPLLYSSAVSMPAMNFRREFGAISGLSVVLVVGTSLLLGVFFMLVIPGLGFAWGVALGAIISPTDAVATSIIKKAPVSKRVVAMLDGESLLNDATALVVLRTVIVAAAASFSFWGALGTFAYSVAVAALIGWLVGWLNLKVRKRVKDPAVNTAISFTVPFIASVPVTLLGGSGLVAAVVAGLITGILAPRELSPQNRVSDTQNWRTVEFALEGAVFLTMGVQIKSIVENVQQDHAGVGTAVLIAGAALVLILIVRAVYVGPLLWFLAVRSRANDKQQVRFQEIQQKSQTPEGLKEQFDEINTRNRPASQRQMDQFARRVTQAVADMKYFSRQPLGWREGAIVVWAGMRGAVTVAAAQSLPAETPQRSVIVLIAFAVAALSLLIQGGTIGWVVRWLAPKTEPGTEVEEISEDQTQVMDLLRTAGKDIPEPVPVEDAPRLSQFREQMDYRLKVLQAQRDALLDARDNGTFDADLLAKELANLDAAQIAMEMRANPTS